MSENFCRSHVPYVLHMCTTATEPMKLLPNDHITESHTVKNLYSLLHAGCLKLKRETNSIAHFLINYSGQICIWPLEMDAAHL